MLKKNESDFCKLLNEPTLELIQKTVFDERASNRRKRRIDFTRMRFYPISCKLILQKTPAARFRPTFSRPKNRPPQRQTLTADTKTPTAEAATLPADRKPPAADAKTLTSDVKTLAAEAKTPMAETKTLTAVANLLTADAS